MRLVAIYGGWVSGQQYNDDRAFAYDLVSSGFGFFTCVRPKK
ncbi:hypothetical protein [Propionicicella superfundia]|nr:hypothetical protein [Propionicicella superfundia]